MNYDLDMSFHLFALDEKRSPLFPTPCTVRHALTKYCDFNALPRKKLLATFAALATDPTEQAELLLLSSKDGKNKYNEWIVR